MIYLIQIVLMFNLLLSSDDMLNAELLYEEGNYSEAKLLYDTISNNTEDYYYLGYQIYYAMDDLNKANEYLQGAIQLNEDKYIDEGTMLGIFINEIKNSKVTLDNDFIDEAIEEMILLLDKYPNNSIVFYRLGYAYKEKKDYDNASKYFRLAYNKNSHNTTYKEMLVTLAKIQEKNGKDEYDRQNYQLSLEYFNKALEYDSTYYPVMFRIGNIYYKIRDYDKAIEMYKMGLENPEILGNTYKLMNQLGKFYTKVNNLDKAMESFDKSLEINANNEQALFEKAKIYNSKGDIDKSKLMLLQVTNMNPNFVNAYELLMDIEKDGKNYDKAISYGQMCLDFNDSSYTVLARMATIYNELNNFEDAKKYAKSSIKFKRKYGPAQFELGYAEMNLCNKVAAKDAFSKAKLDKRYRKIANDYIKNLDLYTKSCE